MQKLEVCVTVCVLSLLNGLSVIAGASCVFVVVGILCRPHLRKYHSYASYRTTHQLSLLLKLVYECAGENRRQKRYLIFTPSTQYGVFATVSIPLSEPDNLVNVAWFFEANYYNVANATYFEPLLGDIVVSRSRENRAASERDGILTRSALYTLIESMLKKHGYSGRPCLLRAICESATTHYSHNGLLGDIFQLILTPSASLPENDLEDCYYEAEYYGLDSFCDSYYKSCPFSPMDEFSMFIDHLL